MTAAHQDAVVADHSTHRRKAVLVRLISKESAILLDLSRDKVHHCSYVSRFAVVLMYVHVKRTCERYLI